MTFESIEQHDDEAAPAPGWRRLGLAFALALLALAVVALL